MTGHHVTRQHLQNDNERRSLAAIIDRVDEAAGRPQIAQAQAPIHGGPQRDAIASLVDGVVLDVIQTIKALQAQLKALEDQVLVSAASAKNTLNEQVDVCARVRDQVETVRDVVDEIAKKVSRL